MTIQPLTPDDIALMAAQIIRLRAIERAAWQALELAREGHAENAYHVLSEALEPTPCAPTL